MANLQQPVVDDDACPSCGTDAPGFSNHCDDERGCGRWRQDYWQAVRDGLLDADGDR